MGSVYMHVYICIYNYTSLMDSVYMHVFVIGGRICKHLFPQFKSPQGGNPGFSQLKSFTNSSYGKRI